MPYGGNTNGRICHAHNGAPGCDFLDTSGKVVAVCNDGPRGSVVAKLWWRYNGGSWRTPEITSTVPAGRQVNWVLLRTGNLLRTHVLGVQVEDPPDFWFPAYYVRARDN